MKKLFNFGKATDHILNPRESFYNTRISQMECEVHEEPRSIPPVHK